MKINTINENIVIRIIEDIDSLDHSLTHGKSGLLIVLSHFYKYNNYKDPKLIKKAIKKCIKYIINDIKSNNIDMSFAFGLSGIGFALRTSFELGQNDLISIEWIEQIDELVVNSVESYLNFKEYDFLRGATGIINYLLCFPSNDLYLISYINSLFNHAIWIDNDKCYWIFYSFNEQTNSLEYKADIVNIGLAHGICSIINILSEIFQKGLRKEDCYKLISGAINFLISIRNVDSIYQFPGIYDKNNFSHNITRLGWCYGDSSVALTIIKAGIKCNNSDWISFGNIIGLKSTQLKFKNAQIEEHGICHGYFGAMHIYQRLFEATKILKYKKMSNYWYKIGMHNRDYSLNNLGFYQTNLNNDGEIFKLTSCELLLGLSGIYLCLTSRLNQDFNWDRLIMTNIKEKY